MELGIRTGSGGSRLAWGWEGARRQDGHRDRRPCPGAAGGRSRSGPGAGAEPGGAARAGALPGPGQGRTAALSSCRRGAGAGTGRGAGTRRAGPGTPRSRRARSAARSAPRAVAALELGHPRGHRSPPGENIARLPLPRGPGGFPPAVPPGAPATASLQPRGAAVVPGQARTRAALSSFLPCSGTPSRAACLSHSTSLPRHPQGVAHLTPARRGGSCLGGKRLQKRKPRNAPTGRCRASQRREGPQGNSCKGARATSELVSRDKGANPARRGPSLRGKGVARVSPPGPACGGASPPVSQGEEHELTATKA
ncbi:collagen alpha-1(III) chain-like [Manacus candei]|uniref:collagen alpha-1(III) chain-like n=1 Tax=Manacus candei TaxID=415023 RepID=UPI00222612B6|nr:collagen alpha-1(III) chain-like [Manacus candei]